MKLEEGLKGRMAVIVLTDQGLLLGRKIINGFREREMGLTMELWVSESANPKATGECHTFKQLAAILPQLWKRSALLIFVMAAGIVVRQVAPLIQSKDRDPAVLVLDQKGRFVIPLLSGHLGGANAWAKEVADQLKAQPVITTATDVEGLTAPDEYARRLGWIVKPISGLKRVNRYLLVNGCLKVYSEVTLFPDHPLKKDEHYIFIGEDEKKEAQIWVTPFNRIPGKPAQESRSIGSSPGSPSDLPCIILVPRILSIGVGSRRGISKEKVLEAVDTSLLSIGASRQSVSGIFSIDLKQHESGMIEAARELGVPFQTFSAAEIQTLADKRELSRSEFVKEKIGVDGVCEAASLLGTKHGELILPKQKQSGVTVAISMERFLS